MTTRDSLEPDIALGIRLCRLGDWERGLQILERVARQAKPTALPGLVLAFLGYGRARFEGRRREGLELCRLGVRLDPFEPDAYHLLAQVHLLAGQRRKALVMVERGLRLDAAHGQLQRLRLELGYRRRPVLPFLAREHSLNMLLGRLRHQLLGLLPERRSGLRSVGQG